MKIALFFLDLLYTDRQADKHWEANRSSLTTYGYRRDKFRYKRVKISEKYFNYAYEKETVYVEETLSYWKAKVPYLF
jgi:hypothetical protein